MNYSTHILRQKFGCQFTTQIFEQFNFIATQYFLNNNFFFEF